MAKVLAAEPASRKRRSWPNQTPAEAECASTGDLQNQDYRGVRTLRAKKWTPVIDSISKTYRETHSLLLAGAVRRHDCTQQGQEPASTESLLAIISAGLSTFRNC